VHHDGHAAHRLGPDGQRQFAELAGTSAVGELERHVLIMEQGGLPGPVATPRWVWGDIHRDVAPPDEGDPPAAPWVCTPAAPLVVYRPSADNNSVNEGYVHPVTHLFCVS
jgi:hypothetical protein